jgi:hypothetical protein
MEYYLVSTVRRKFSFELFGVVVNYKPFRARKKDIQFTEENKMLCFSCTTHVNNYTQDRATKWLRAINTICML